LTTDKDEILDVRQLTLEKHEDTMHHELKKLMKKANEEGFLFPLSLSPYPFLFIHSLLLSSSQPSLYAKRLILRKASRVRAVRD
jgi:hypothetical protein